MNAPQQSTLSQLQRSIREAIVGRFALPVWVSAEVMDLKVNGSGHCYMELVEKGESDGIARAQARGVVWRSAYEGIAQRFEMQTGQKLGRGIKILAKVLVTYHELYGMSLQITDIDPTYTIGESERERQEAISKLKANGSWDMNRAQPMPRLAQRVAVISSAQAAGYQDFARELSKSSYYIGCTLFEATMQGEAAEGSIIAALIAIAARREEFDMVVIIRGGGSTNDLRCFDSYRLALHFARFPRPVVAGIGHDKDISVVDMVAHTSLKTPTAVAGWLVERLTKEDEWLYSVALDLQRTTTERRRRESLTLERYSSEATMRCEELINRKKRELIERLEALPELAMSLLTMRSKELDHHSTVVEGYSPQRLLELGFAVARVADKGSVKSVKEVNIGEEMSIQLSDGELTTEIKRVKRYGE